MDSGLGFRVRVRAKVTVRVKARVGITHIRCRVLVRFRVTPKFAFCVVSWE